MYIAAKGKGVVVGRCFAAVPLIGQGHDWQLPYSAVVLPPNEMPSAYFNKKGLMERQNSKGRFIIQLPLLPYAAGPVQYDQMGNPIFQQLPNGHVIYSYYDELEYHAQLQQQQQQQPLPLHPSAGGSTAAGSSASERQQQQQQQQHQPLPQSNAVASSSINGQQMPTLQHTNSSISGSRSCSMSRRQQQQQGMPSPKLPVVVEAGDVGAEQEQNAAGMHQTMLSGQAMPQLLPLLLLLWMQVLVVGQRSLRSSLLPRKQQLHAVAVASWELTDPQFLTLWGTSSRSSPMSQCWHQNWWRPC
jgi:hypothetical protein